MSVIDFLKSLPHVEPEADYLNATNYYPVLNALARDLRATRVLEIGVRYGYSAVAFSYQNPIAYYCGMDANLYEANSLLLCGKNLEHFNRVQPLLFTLIETNTRTLPNLALLCGTEYDLVHIDGDHTCEGAYSDMKMFWDAVALDGHMLVDDVLFIDTVAQACEDFAADLNEPNYIVQSLRGTRVFRKTRPTAGTTGNGESEAAINRPVLAVQNRRERAARN